MVLVVYYLIQFLFTVVMLMKVCFGARIISIISLLQLLMNREEEVLSEEELKVYPS